MQEVLAVYAARENGIGEALAGGWDASPRMLVEGVAEFERAYKRASAWYRARDEERRENERKNRSKPR